MAEPWLDSLSEDWNSPPATSPSALPTFGTPTASMRSRIPRYSYGKKDTSASTSQRRRSLDGSLNKRALSERSVSDRNLPLHSSSAGNSPKKPGLPLQETTKSATSSVGSVVKHDSVERKPFTHNSTPEWKKLVLKGTKGAGTQTDLFTTKPLGLQGLFQKPPDVEAEEEMKLFKPALPLLESSDMPSSPPPWPSNPRAAHYNNFSSFLGDSSHVGLEAVAEQDEAEDGLNGTSTGVLSDPDPSSVLQPKGNTNTSAQRQNRTRGNIAWIPQGGLSGLPSSEDDDIGPLSGHLAPPGFQQYQQVPQASPIKHQGSVQGSSSTTGGFSPVNIMKYNTQDGSVDYAAVDVSNPESAELLKSCMKSASAHTERSRTPDGTDRFPDQGLSYTQDPRNWTTSQMPHISPYVTIERGGHSEDDGFRHRLLSSAIPSSCVESSSPLGPSDSVSQIHTYEPQPAPTQARFVQKDAFTFTPPEPEDPTLSSTAVGGQNSPNKKSSPFKIFGKHDTITNARLASRMEQMSLEPPQAQTEEGMGSENAKRTIEANGAETETVKSSGTVRSAETMIRRSVSPDQPADQGSFRQIRRPRTPDARQELETELEQQNKRPNSVLSAQHPTPKRRRTLGQGEIQDCQEHVSATVREQTRRMQAAAILGKRKDARYDDEYGPCDPEELADREILRPRNPTPAQIQMIASMGTQASAASPELSSIQQSIHEYPLPDGVEDGEGIKALALGVATIRISQRIGDETARKASYTTQEYVAEAMNLMNLLRSRATGEVPILEEQEPSSSAVRDPHDEEVDARNSRPPSREGAARGWRSRDDQKLDPRIVAALAKYQEINDESFLAPNDEQTDEEEEEAQEQVYIRITEPPRQDTTSDSPIKTQSSNPSVDSGRTINTNLSQRSRTVHITPDMVTHLIQDNRAGMRYDGDTMRWVRVKKPERDADHSSSTGTDPFHDVSDLEVHDQALQQNYQIPAPRALSSLQVPKTSNRPMPRGDAQPQGQLSIASREVSSHSSMPRTLELDINESSLAACNEEPTREIGIRGSQLQSEDDEDLDIVEADALQSMSQSPASPIQSYRQDESSLMQSSPPIHDARLLAYQESQEDEDVDDFPDSPDETQELDKSQLHTNRVRWGQASSRQVSTRRVLHQDLETSLLHEHQEISFIETRPDGRTFSLTCAKSTPFPRRNLSRTIVPSSGLRGMVGMTPLSDLSEFTVQQDDAKHIKARNLSAGSQEGQSMTVIHAPPVVASQMIARITDVEPSQNDWEYIESLDLSKSKLESLFLLDELCPQLHSLEAGSNALKHLTGAPPSIRELKVPNNQLSQTTFWAHMANLQYLDVSNNDLESLSGLTSLIHLRELKADHNHIGDLDSILDLDGLLSLSVERNCLQRLNFSGATLPRLTKLNLKGNSLVEVSNLQCLPALEVVDLQDNLLDTLKATNGQGRSMNVKELYLASNMIKELDVSQFPNVETLDVDGNRLSHISGLTGLANLTTLSARNQQLPGKTSIDAILAASTEIAHLRLSGNALPSLNTLSASIPFLNTRTLDLSLCGLQSLPTTFASAFPNIRTLDLSLNPIKDLRPLRGLQRITTLNARGTRVHRLRRTLSALGAAGRHLTHLDLRDAPLTLGFYPPRDLGGKEWVFRQRMDEETRLRLKVYGLMLAAKCPLLEEVDGSKWDRRAAVGVDVDFRRLVDIGVVEVGAGR